MLLSKSEDHVTSKNHDAEINSNFHKKAMKIYIKTSFIESVRKVVQHGPSIVFTTNCSNMK